MTDPELLDNLEETARKAGAVVGVEKEQFLRLVKMARVTQHFNAGEVDPGDESFMDTMRQIAGTLQHGSNLMSVNLGRKTFLALMARVATP